ncbi:MAG TPA: cytochrome c1 [Nevskiaceae bacterium]|nr:cytochrome c1 [Nevskiaceae bacterium]
MKRLLIALASLTLSATAQAAGGGPLPFSYEADTSNLASLQRGARNFMAYCSGCHSMKYLRYNRIGQDLEIPEALLKANLMFTSEKVGDHILTAMPGENAKTWFGQTPPDLTLETRARGTSWVYSYLKTFYVDPSRPLGVNNLVLAGASMPHVLADLQGWQVKKAVAEGETPAAGKAPVLELAVPGSLDAEGYDQFVADTVNFMAYAAEPGKSHRIDTGIRAILYLLVLLTLAYLLKKEYWKDVH